jgi:hypothetical protein
LNSSKFKAALALMKGWVLQEFFMVRHCLIRSYCFSPSIFGMLGLEVDWLDSVEFCKIQGSFGTHEVGVCSGSFSHRLPLFDQYLLVFFSIFGMLGLGVDWLDFVEILQNSR